MTLIRWAAWCILSAAAASSECARAEEINLNARVRELFVGISLIFRGFNWIGLGLALRTLPRGEQS